MIKDEQVYLLTLDLLFSTNPNNNLIATYYKNIKAVIQIISPSITHKLLNLDENKII
jgi:hypothetical protein